MTRIKESEHWITTWDGTRLFYRAWEPSTPPKKAIILFHRGHEHSGRFRDLVEQLALDDFSIFAWDARGHGRSPGERGWAENFLCLVKDADAFVRFISREHEIPIENCMVMAHSVGSVPAGDHRSLLWIFFVMTPLQYALVGIDWYGLFSILSAWLWASPVDLQCRRLNAIVA